MGKPSKGTSHRAGNKTKPEERNEKTRWKQQLMPPGNITIVCGICWENGRSCSRSKTMPTYCAASKTPHIWERECICISHPGKEIIRQPPMNCSGYAMCWHTKRDGKCRYKKCRFAHSEVELGVWRWMKENNCKYVWSIMTYCNSLISFY